MVPSAWTWSGTKVVERTPMDGTSIELGSEASRKVPMPMSLPAGADVARVERGGGTSVAGAPAEEVERGGGAVVTAGAAAGGGGEGEASVSRSPRTSATTPTTSRTAVATRARVTLGA